VNWGIAEKGCQPGFQASLELVCLYSGNQSRRSSRIVVGRTFGMKDGPSSSLRIVVLGAAALVGLVALGLHIKKRRNAKKVRPSGGEAPGTRTLRGPGIHCRYNPRAHRGGVTALSSGLIA
jgi:hypothetical protein